MLWTSFSIQTCEINKHHSSISNVWGSEKNTAITSRSAYGKSIKFSLLFSFFTLSVNSQVWPNILAHRGQSKSTSTLLYFHFLNWSFKIEMIAVPTTVSDLNPVYIKMYVRGPSTFTCIRDTLAAVNSKWTVGCFICRTRYWGNSAMVRRETFLCMQAVVARSVFFW